MATLINAKTMQSFARLWEEQKLEIRSKEEEFEIANLIFWLSETGHWKIESV